MVKGINAVKNYKMKTKTVFFFKGSKLQFSHYEMYLLLLITYMYEELMLKV